MNVLVINAGSSSLKYQLLSPATDAQLADHRANGFKCAGLWKVYGDEAKAQALFAKFKKCTEIYCALWQTGSKLEQLAVAV